MIVNQLDIEKFVVGINDSTFWLTGPDILNNTAFDAVSFNPEPAIEFTILASAWEALCQIHHAVAALEIVVGIFSIKIAEVVVENQSRGRDEGDAIIIADQATVVLCKIIFAGAVLDGTVGKGGELCVAFR